MPSSPSLPRDGFLPVLEEKRFRSLTQTTSDIGLSGRDVIDPDFVKKVKTVEEDNFGKPRSQSLLYSRHILSDNDLELSRRDNRSRAMAITNPDQKNQGQTLKLLGNKKFGRHLT